MTKRLMLRVLPVACYLASSISMATNEVGTVTFAIVSSAFVIAYFSGLFLGADIYEEVNG